VGPSLLTTMTPSMNSWLPSSLLVSNV